MDAMITPAILSLLLRPYCFEVTQRCLTDWRYKGYLPQLERVSRGYRKGILRRWKQTDILQIALDVCRRLREHGHKRTYGVEYKNWLGGAEIPVSRARKSWTNEFKRRAHIPKQLICRGATHLAAKTGLRSDTVADTLAELQNIIFSPRYEVGVHQDIVFICRLAQRVFKRISSPGKLIVIDERLIEAFLVFVNAYFSPAAIQNLINSASDQELLKARNRWLAGWRKWDDKLRWLFGSAESGQATSPLMGLAGVLAPLGVAWLLPMRPATAVLSPPGAA